MEVRPTHHETTAPKGTLAASCKELRLLFVAPGLLHLLENSRSLFESGVQMIAHGRP